MLASPDTPEQVAARDARLDAALDRILDEHIDLAREARIGDSLRGRVDTILRAAEQAPTHPALQWQVNGALLAHRRAGEEMTACGRTGELTVVTDVGVPPCPKCYGA
jgi:hypothetical protein